MVRWKTGPVQTRVLERFYEDSLGMFLAYLPGFSQIEDQIEDQLED